MAPGREDRRMAPLRAAVGRGLGVDVRAAIGRRLGIDTRALAAFRIALGPVLLADLAYRTRNLGVFYTDGGVFPRAANSAVYPTLSSLSLHAVSGAARFQWLLFAVATVFTLGLLVGYRTRVVAVGAWLLLASLQLRNYLVLNGGDTVLLVALFLGLFLPLGERWSLDALADRREARPRTRVAGFGTAALLSQVLLVYATNAVFKLRSDAWTGGRAIPGVYGVDRFTVRFGDALAEFTGVLTALDYAWVGLLVASPLLVVAAGRGRTVLVGAFGAAHVGMYLTLDLGFFPHAMLACLLVFLPTAVWDRVEAAVEPAATVLRTWLDGSLVVAYAGPTFPRGVRSILARAAPAVTATILVVGLLWHGVAVGAVAAPDGTPVDPAEHSWKLFAPNPPTTDGWFVVTGTLESGATVDLYPHADTLEARPRDTAATYPTTRWRKYLGEVRGNAVVRRYFADYLCRRGTSEYGEPVDAVAIEYVREPAADGGADRTDRVDLGRYRCPVVD